MDLFTTDYKITKPLRLIELFAGYGSQAMAFDRIGAKYEHWFVCEFDKYAMKSYNAVHGTNFQPTDIRDIHGKDLNIVDTENYCYFMTYSFPCTDLSRAGKMAGMKKGSGTRSGLLWEVERLLNECDELPQILFLENVPDLLSEQNADSFSDWIHFLNKKGYSSRYSVLNAKDYGIPQNRERCFMFSFLGDFDYEFPKPEKLDKKLKNILESKVDEKYYIKNEKAQALILDLLEKKIIPTEQNRTEQMMFDSSTLLQADQGNCSFPRQFAQDMTQELANINVKGAAYLNYKLIKETNVEIATTLCARDYKGFGTGFNCMNGVIE